MWVPFPQSLALMRDPVGCVIDVSVCVVFVREVALGYSRVVLARIWRHENALFAPICRRFLKKAVQVHRKCTALELGHQVGSLDSTMPRIAPAGHKALFFLQHVYLRPLRLMVHSSNQASSHPPPAARSPTSRMLSSSAAPLRS